MQPSPVRDLTVGSFVLAGLAAIAYLSIQVGGLSYKGPGGFELYATFDDVGGLQPRAPVSIGGVKVGQVTVVELDDDLRARVTLDLDPRLEIAPDARAQIRTSGLLGDQFVSLDPGGGEDGQLEPGDEIAFTESAISIEGLIGKFVHDAGLEEEE
jgi:phospholipid/cholesterol/gamma-HCH transport system substrate-binding protein